MRAIIITGQSLGIVANGGETAVTRPDPNDTTHEAEGREQRVIVGKPVTVKGSSVSKYTVDDATLTAFMARDAASRVSGLTNVRGKVQKSGRVQVREDQWTAVQRAAIAAVGGPNTGDLAADIATLNGAQRASIMAAYRDSLASGYFVIPAVEGDDDDDADPFAAIFAVAEAATEDDADDADDDDADDDAPTDKASK